MRAAAMAAVSLLLTHSCVAQFLGVSPPRVPGVFEQIGCPRVSQLPLRTNAVTAQADSTVSISVEAWCDGKPIGGLATSTCALRNNWVVLDDGNIVSDLEAEMRVEVEPGNPQTMILIDLSNSIASQINLEGATKAAVIQLIDSLFAGASQMGGKPSIAIHAFDGRSNTQLVHDWSEDQNSLKASVNALTCDATSANGMVYCTDPSTNLYGTIVDAANMMGARRSSVLTTQTSRGYDNALIVFTDGDDLANRVSVTDARAAIEAQGLLVFAIGGASAKVQDMIAITGDSNAAFVGQSLTDLPGLSQQVSDLLVPFYSRSYRITYCSPRRRGLHTVDVMVMQNGVQGPSMGFITGERVAFVRNAQTGEIVMGTVQTVTTDATNGVRVVRYQVLLENTNPQQTVTATDTELRHVYSADQFTSTPQCPLRTSTQSIRTAPCVAPASSAGLEPYTCTGGSQYSCATGVCECPLQSSAATCAAQTCQATDQTTVPALVVQKNCANGLPQAPIPISTTDYKVLADSTLSLVFMPRCSDGSAVGGLTFSPCSDLSSLKLYETDAAKVFKPVSLYESRPRITCVPQPAHAITLMLLDMSDSIRRGYGAMQRMKEYAIAYIDGIGLGLNSHIVAVYTFDGQSSINLLANFGSATAAKNAIAALDCSNNRCLDHSTNLNGAIVMGSGILQSYFAGNRVNPRDNVTRQPFLAIFTDGADQAQYYSDIEARNAASNGTGIFAVGLQGEVRSGIVNNQVGMRGVDVARLRNISPAGLYILPTAAQLKEEFSKVGQAIASAAAKSYRLDYCSPKRNGVHEFRLELTQPDGQKTHWQQSFNADDSFNCVTANCNQCLGGALTEEFQCGKQPTQANQNFACAGGAQPVSRNGYCRCPCTDEASYPGPSVVGPGPIICEPQGTCAQGDRVTCSSHGGLPVQAPGVSKPFVQFGVNLNSQVSMRFTPMCADEWPMPKLRMSVCDPLSDFEILETNAQGVLEKVSKFESEPRVVCYPDVVSAILLDTSGSVRLGDGEEAIRNAVRTYLTMMNSRLQVRHHVAIYAFDGKETIQQIIGFTSNYDTAMAAINSWSCGGAQQFCSDFSTNLYGAIQQIVNNVLTPQVATLAWTQQPHLILLSDGTDQAARASEADALAALNGVTYPLETYAVGLVGEMNNGMMGLDSESLKRLAKDGVFVAANTAELGTQFQEVANAIISRSLEEETATYRIDYCSPKRQGLTNVTVVLKHEGQEYRWSQSFDAGTFQCENNQCRSCLSRVKYSCTDQPLPGTNGGDQQFFSCDPNTAGQTDPVVHNNQCKCPCVGTYPPDATPAPLIQTPTPVFATPLPGGFTSPPGGLCTMFDLSGFTLISGLNQRYTRDDTRPIWGQPTYWAASGGYYMYYCTSSLQTATDVGGQWRIAQMATYPLVSGSTSNPACNSVARSSTASTGLVGGPWVERSVTSASFQSLQVGLSCGGTGTPPPGTGGPTAIVALPTVSGVIGPQTTQSVFTNVQSGSTNVALPTPTCTPTVANILDGAITAFVRVATNTVDLQYTGKTLGTTPVTCVFSNTLGTSTYSFNMVISNTPVVTSTPLAGLNNKLLLGIGQSPASFNKALFLQRIQTILAARRLLLVPTVNWVCPESVCKGTNVCPNAAGCLSGVNIPSRAAEVLQQTDIVSYVEVPLVYAATGLPANEADMAAAINAINDDINVCQSNSNQNCQLGVFNPVRSAALANPSGVVDLDDDDDSDTDLEGWEIALIIAGCLLCLSIVAALIYLLTRKKKDKAPKEQPYAYDSPQRQKEVSTYDDTAPQGTRSGAGPSQSYDESYYSQSYYDYDVFNVDDDVRALYVDGEWYDATIWAVGADGTYEVKWYDGTHSEGLPADQLQRK
eukprot:TRINITY_DN73546_c0_g1_i1.p1 TRINITY_DN73546_c0_g1~~TRINITY_DN73546_c0_g1_i1.p1  ORF type:complete len:1868 (+),score=635.93 TRINITY_DN73546_c0_g1_i1:128-5731(+)